MASTSPARSPTRSLWADLSDEAEEDRLCPVSAAWECMSSHTASSFEGDARDTWVPNREQGATNIGASASASSCTANQQRDHEVRSPEPVEPFENASTYTAAAHPKYATGAFLAERQEGRPWASTSSLEATESVATGMCPLPSSSSASWSACPCLFVEAPLPQIDVRNEGLPHAPTSRPVDAPRRLRLKNKKLTPKNSDSGSSKDTEEVNVRKVSEFSSPTEDIRATSSMSAAPAQASDSFSSTSSRPKVEGEWSVGSLKHETGRCRRCLFYDSPVGCIKGARCDFCHLPHYRSSCTRPSKAKRDRYARLFQEIAEKRAKQAAAAAASSSGSRPQPQNQTQIQQSQTQPQPQPQAQSSSSR